MIFFSIDNLASKAKIYTKYLNVKTKLHKIKANIYFNKECLKHKLTPTCAKIKIKDTNKAATKAKEQSETLRIKNELTWSQNIRENWPIIENQIHEQIKHITN